MKRRMVGVGECADFFLRSRNPAVLLSTTSRRLDLPPSAKPSRILHKERGREASGRGGHEERESVSGADR